MMAEEIVVSNNMTPNSDEKNIATITHLAGTVFSFIPALIVWLLKKEDSAYIAHQAKEALNFQITVALAMFVTTYILTWILVGFALMPLILLANVIFCIIAAVATSKGETYRYPVCLRFIN